MIHKQFQYSMMDVRRAGKTLGTTVPVSWNMKEPTPDDVVRPFSVAQEWRDFHLVPMRSIRASVRAKTKKLTMDDAVTVARLKRFASVRKKLSKKRQTLAQMQDLGGVRVILSSVSELDFLTSSLVNHFPHELYKIDDYCFKAKQSGYRSKHLLYKFRHKGNLSVYNDRRIEVQLRTQLQHAWATAVELVGTYLNQDMKSGEGDPHWLRLFELMSDEIVEREYPLEAIITSEKSARKTELSELNSTLGAVRKLNNMRVAFNEAKNRSQYELSKNLMYLVKFNDKNKTVSVTPFTGLVKSTQSYQLEERSGVYNSVLIQAEAIEALKIAFPNYFGDVALFTSLLTQAIDGKETEFHKLPNKPQRAPMKKVEVGDVSSILPSRKRLWSEPNKYSLKRNK